MADLVVIVPSRGRPENIRRLVDAWADTRAQAALVVVVDNDDPHADRYAGAIPLEIGFIIRSDRLRLGGTLNKHAVELLEERWEWAVGEPSAIGFLGDDHLPRTPRWDEAILDALDELGSGIAYGNDLLQGEKLPTAAFMTSDIIRTLGWMVPPGLVHLYIDDAWRELGNAMGRLKYLPDVVIEHMHPDAGKASWDERYAEVNSGAQASADKAAFDAWMANDLAGNVAALRAAGLC